jgi:type IV pilus assembly protein PilB
MPKPSAQPVTSSFNSETIADILAAEGVLAAPQLEQIKLEQANTGKDVKTIIAEQNFASEEQLARASARFHNVPFVDLAETGVAPEAITYLPQSVAERYNLIPFNFSREKNELSVAMVEPLDLATIEFIEKKSRVKVKPFQATKTAVQTAIQERYAKGLTTEVKAALKEAGEEPTHEKAVDITKLGEIIREAPVAKIVSTILDFAMRARASDIHIEPEEDKTRVRYRIDGILHEKLILPKKVHEAVISRIKILSGMKIDEKRLPQDGRFSFEVGEKEVDLRVSCLPTSHGEKIVMRLLKKGGKIPPLPELGLRGRALKNLDDAILRPHGIILVCGPTGSGKTTTLYSVLDKINTTKVNIMTLEDPIEYEILGVNQVQVNPAAGLTFASGMRSFVRQDPNIILVGEIRDRETTELAIQAALTGHLVFSTLHTNDASGAVPRLLDLGAEPFLLASAMTCIVGQRICRKICQDCKEEYKPDAAIVEDMKKVLGKLYQEEKASFKLFRGKKCPQCNNTGYFGRIGIFEVLPLTEKVARLTLERAPASEIKKVAVEEGMVTMKQDGYLKVIEGVTTIEEVLRVAED